MKETKMKTAFVTPILVLGLALPACTHTGAKYEPIADGGQSATYTADLADCQKLATERGYLNADTGTNAAIGAGIGAIAGVADDDISDAEGVVAGAVVGAIVGAGATMMETRGERRDIVIACMQGRGHKVVG